MTRFSPELVERCMDAFHLASSTDAFKRKIVEAILEASGQAELVEALRKATRMLWHTQNALVGGSQKAFLESELQSFENLLAKHRP